MTFPNLGLCLPQRLKLKIRRLSKIFLPANGSYFLKSSMQK